MNKEHGSPWDRGAADSYYRRQPNPHMGGVGGTSGPHIPQECMSEQEVQEYHEGYQWNEQNGDKKEWK